VRNRCAWSSCGAAGAGAGAGAAAAGEAHHLGGLLRGEVLEHDHPPAVEDGERRRRGGLGPGRILRAPSGGGERRPLGSDRRQVWALWKQSGEEEDGSGCGDLELQQVAPHALHGWFCDPALDLNRGGSGGGGMAEEGEGRRGGSRGVRRGDVGRRRCGAWGEPATEEAGPEG
jgi:hypothetical protein